MAKRGGRSKACVSCRRAKKKVSGDYSVERHAIVQGQGQITHVIVGCDGVYPQCGPCVAANRPCPGPIQGNVFVNTDVSTIQNRTARHAARHNSQTHLGSDTEKDPSDGRSLLSLQKGSISMGRISKRSYTLAGNWKEFHSVPLHDMQVISNLVRYYTFSGRKPISNSRDKQSWLVRLPSLLQQKLSIRMRAPLLAPSLVLIALQSKEPRMLKEALKWYDRGLSYIRTRLMLLNDRVPDEVEDTLLICAALFMSIYETLHTTVVGGYEKHVMGAVALLQAKGPELFAKPEYHDLFLAIRGHAIHVSLITGKPTCLADEEWLSKPFALTSRTKFERTNDIFLLIPKYLSELQLELSNTLDMLEQNSVKQIFMRKFDLMRRDLDELGGCILQYLKPMPSSKDSTSPQDTSTKDNSSHRDVLYDFASPIHAKIVAMHACARIIILGILSSTTLSPSPWPCFFPIENWHDGTLILEMEEASKRIISASQYLSRFMIGCAYARMVLPLQLVGQMSPSQSQRAEARNILQSWYNDTPVKGLTMLALQAIDTASNWGC